MKTTVLSPALPWPGELTLLDLILAVQQFTRNEDETVEAVSSLIDSGRVRLLQPGASRRLASVDEDLRRRSGSRDVG